uniref:Uncharacterized protein n=1 Tax=Rhizophagus irregularis (strain DAOM 181602 / DAOM 197198 / MUCL 43194) TaxID=747089 RepID=U9SN24_RHIID
MELEWTKSNIPIVQWSKSPTLRWIWQNLFGKLSQRFIPYWDIEGQKWKRECNIKVALKSLDNSSCISTEFLNEIKTHLQIYLCDVIQCYGITQDPNTKDYI